MPTRQDILVASGPVIIEDGKILLVRPQSALRDFWVFPGGKVDLVSLEDPRAACIREAKEELGIDIEIVKPMRTLILPQVQHPDRLAVLIHFLARRQGEPQKTEEILEWAWQDIQNLPKNTTQNVREMAADYLRDI